MSLHWASPGFAPLCLSPALQDILSAPGVKPQLLVTKGKSRCRNSRLLSESKAFHCREPVEREGEAPAAPALETRATLGCAHQWVWGLWLSSASTRRWDLRAFPSFRNAVEHVAGLSECKVKWHKKVIKWFASGYPTHQGRLELKTRCPQLLWSALPTR